MLLPRHHRWQARGAQEHESTMTKYRPNRGSHLRVKPTHRDGIRGGVLDPGLTGISSEHNPGIPEALRILVVELEGRARVGLGCADRSMVRFAIPDLAATTGSHDEHRCDMGSARLGGFRDQAPVHDAVIGEPSELPHSSTPTG